MDKKLQEMYDEVFMRAHFKIVTRKTHNSKIDPSVVIVDN